MDAKIRIRKEMVDMQKNPPENCSAGPRATNLFHWRGTILGPPSTPYAGGMFHIDIQFPNSYPFQPPHLKFETQIYHPNINGRGEICLDILKHEWSPALTLSDLLLSISSLLDDPNPNDPLVPTIAAQYRQDRDRYDAIAQEWTMRFARN